MSIRIIILVLCFNYIALSQTAAEIVEEIQEKYEEMDNLTAEFLQVDQFKLTGSKNEMKGKIYIKEGVKYRLETDDQVVVTDGKSVWTYSKHNNQVLIDRLKEGDGSLLPRDLLFKYPNDYFATLLGEDELNRKNCFLLKLDPKEDVHGFIQTMKIWVDSDSYIIYKIKYTDFNDNISLFEIKSINTDKELPDSFFNFKIKEGIDVVDLRM